VSAGDYSQLCRINWRMGGDLRAVFATFSDESKRKVLDTAGALILADAQKAIAAKGWGHFGEGIRNSLTATRAGETMEVGSDHVAAGMRHFGGTISAPGQSPVAKKRAWLTIPVRGSPAKGKTYTDLKLGGWKFFRIISRKSGFPVLMGYQGKAKPQPLFALRKQVTHPASPWFPTYAQITGRVTEAFRAQLPT
jgi:hypothetical protein